VLGQVLDRRRHEREQGLARRLRWCDDRRASRLGRGRCRIRLGRGRRGRRGGRLGGLGGQTFLLAPLLLLAAPLLGLVLLLERVVRVLEELEQRRRTEVEGRLLVFARYIAVQGAPGVEEDADGALHVLRRSLRVEGRVDGPVAVGARRVGVDRAGSQQRFQHAVLVQTDGDDRGRLSARGHDRAAGDFLE
jgi:hypothetical protein